MKIKRYIKCATGTGLDMQQAFQNKLDELSGGIEMSSSINSVDDVMLEDEQTEDFEDAELYPSDDSEEKQFNNYEEFLDFYNATLDEPVSEEQILDELESLQDAINQIIPQDEDEIKVLVDECPIFWDENSEYPSILINDDRYTIEYTTDEDGNLKIELIGDDSDLIDELGVAEDSIDDEAI